MATSGSMNYATSTQEIITEALELLGVLGEGEAYTPSQYTSSARTLNMMIKNWQAAGLNLFAVKRNILYLKKGQLEYKLSSDTLDHFAADPSSTVTTAAAGAGASTIVVASTQNMVIGAKIGITLESGTDLFWTTISSLAGLNVGLSAPLPTAVKNDVIVHHYTITASRPMRVLESYLRRLPAPGQLTDIPMGMLSRVDYYQLSTKLTKATPLQLYVDYQRTYAIAALWPVADNESNVAVMLCQRTLDDFDNAADEPDYPQEWFLPLSYNLATMLAPKYGTPTQDYARIQQTALKLYKDAFDWDAEQGTSIYFKPDNWGMDIGRRGN